MIDNIQNRYIVTGISLVNDKIICNTKLQAKAIGEYDLEHEIFFNNKKDIVFINFINNVHYFRIYIQFNHQISKELWFDDKNIFDTTVSHFKNWLSNK